MGHEVLLGRHLDSVGAMNGRPDLRLGITDVAPVVSCGSFSARAVVGEHLPVTATVFREGHDAVAANVCGPTPDGNDGAFTRMAKLPPEPDRWLATLVPDREGRWAFRVEAWSDPLATWRHAVEVKVEAGQGADELANDLEDGARLLDRVAADAEPDSARPRRRGRRRATRSEPGADGPHRAGAGGGSAAVPARAPGARTGHPLPPLRGVGRPAPRALRLLVRVLPPLRGARRGGQRRRTGRSPPRPTGCRLSPTWASTSSTCRRSTRSARSTARVRTPRPGGNPPSRPGRRRLTVGDRQRRGRARRRPPAAGHDGGLPRLRRAHPGARHGGRARLRAPGAPDHPWVTAHPEWFTTKPDGTIAYAENPPKKYQDIYPINFDNDPEGLYAECLRVMRVGSPRACGSSASTTRTPSR